MCCTQGEWRSFVDAQDDGEYSQRTVDALIVQLLNEFLERIWKTLTSIEKLEVGQSAQRELLIRRWKQMETMIVLTIKTLQI